MDADFSADLFFSINRSLFMSQYNSSGKWVFLGQKIKNQVNIL